MKESLAKWNVVPAKSSICKFPDNIDPSLWKHVIRGLMDGDGWISHNPKEKRCSLCGTKWICEFVAKYALDVCDCHCSISSDRDKKDWFREMRMSGGLQVKRFLDNIYQDANLYLERKYQAYKDIYC